MNDDAFRFTALDARRFDFGTALRGYDRARVEQFREQVADELERLTRATQELELKARNFHEQLRAYRDRDKALNDALVSAQQLRGEIREQAEREAQLLVREAQAQAERELEAVRADVARARSHLHQLVRARRAFAAQQRALLERQLLELAAAEQALEAGGEATAEPRVEARGEARGLPAPDPRGGPVRGAPRPAAGEAASWLDTQADRG